MLMKKYLVLITLLLLLAAMAQAQSTCYSKKMAQSQGRVWTHGKGWDYVNGLVAKSLLMTYEQYKDSTVWSSEFYTLAKAYADSALCEDGSFRAFKKGNIDNINAGKVLFEIYRRESELDRQNGTNHASRYRKAADFLRNYLKNDYSRIRIAGAEGGFFHKNIYPNQMWLDGLYMGAAFYAEWQKNFAPQDYEAWSDIARQFILIHQHTYDAKKGLNYHAWSADPQDANSFWANKKGQFKGCSKEFWGRGMGWYFAALVDVLDGMPSQHPDRMALVKITRQVANGLARWQDEQSGVWYQLLQHDDTFKGACGNANYLESSASSMFTYAYLKGMRIGVLSPNFRSVAEKAYRGLLATFVTENVDGSINLNSTCRSAGLGPASDPKRDGTGSYYLCGGDVRRVNNEGKAIGPFIMASLEYEKMN